MQAMEFRTRSIPSKKKTWKELKKMWHFVSHMFCESLAYKKVPFKQQVIKFGAPLFCFVVNAR